MTADHGRRALAWYDRRQPTLLRAAALRAHLRVTPRIGLYVDVLDGETSIACARFTNRGSLVSAWGLTVGGKRRDFRVAGFGTAREILDELTAWIAAGRPDTDIVQRLTLTSDEQAAVDRLNHKPEKGPEHLAEVLPFRPRKQS